MDATPLTLDASSFPWPTGVPELSEHTLLPSPHQGSGALGEARTSRLILSMADAKLDADLAAVAVTAAAGNSSAAGTSRGGGTGGTRLDLWGASSSSGVALMAAALSGRPALMDEMLQVRVTSHITLHISLIIWRSGGGNVAGKTI